MRSRGAFEAELQQLKFAQRQSRCGGATLA